MQTRLIDFKFYATLLDAFTGYLKSDAIYERYWGFSENPPHTPEEFREKQFQSLIDTINRVPFDSEAADKGTAFNEAVDCLIENRPPVGMQFIKVYEGGKIACSSFKPGKEEKVVELMAAYNSRAFLFPMPLLKEFANYYKGALTQQFVQAVLPTCFGNVLLYGYIDELMPMSVHDIKTTGSYYVGKFKDHWQHVVYPYCLMQNGSDVRLFEYNVTDFKQTYTESYTFVPERDIPILTSHCEELIRFLNDNRDLITNKKIFAEDE